MTRFTDRADAGRRLGQALVGRWPGQPVVVLGLPRGGVPVAAEVAAALGAPLDVLVVRKLGVPWQPELAMGAVAGGGVRFVDPAVVRQLGVPADQVEAVTRRELVELERRERAYREDRPPAPVAGRVVVLVDDGLATGATVRAAVQAVRAAGPARVVVAVPVGAPGGCRALREVADEVVCLEEPDRFVAVGAWYDDFGQTGDDEVRRLLSAAGA